jgi:hypothetical protein
MLCSGWLCWPQTFCWSRYQPATALAILRYTPPLTLRAGVVINVMPLLLMAVIVSLWTLSLIHALGGVAFSKSISRILAAAALYLLAVTTLDPSLYLDPRWTLLEATRWISLASGQPLWTSTPARSP